MSVKYLQNLSNSNIVAWTSLPNYYSEIDLVLFDRTSKQEISHIPGEETCQFFQLSGLKQDFCTTRMCTGMYPTHL